MPAKYPLLEEIDRETNRNQWATEEEEDFGPTVPASAIKSKAGKANNMFSNQKSIVEEKGKYIKINLAPQWDRMLS